MSMTDEKTTGSASHRELGERAEARRLRRELFDDELVDQLLAAADEHGDSALASSNSRSRADLPGIPGREADSAANAPSLATCRTRMIVDRSTPASDAA